jgi:hypothetical protein
MFIQVPARKRRYDNTGTMGAREKFAINDGMVSGSQSSKDAFKTVANTRMGYDERESGKEAMRDEKCGKHGKNMDVP